MALENRLPLLFAILALGWLVYLLSPILTPFVAAGLLAYVGDPLVDRFERMRVPRGLAVAIVFILLLLLLGALTLLVVPLARGQVELLLAKLPEYVNWIESRILPHVLETLDLAGSGEDVGLAAFLEKHGTKVAGFATTALASVSKSGSALITVVLNLLLIPVLTFYLMRDWDIIMERLAALIPADRRGTAVDLARQTDRALGGFLRGQLMVMLGLGLIYATGLGIIGIDYWLAIGTVAGLVSFVPYLGFVVGIGLAGLTALVQMQSWVALVGVIIVFGIGQLIEGTLLTPRLVGDRIGLHPVMVIFAVMAGGQLFGFFGILLALPAAAVVTVLVRFAYGHYSSRRATRTGGATDDAASDEGAA